MELSTRLAWLAILALCAGWMYHAVPALGTVYEDDHWREAIERGGWTLHTRPLTLLVWRLTGGSHAVSLALHLVNAAVVGWLAWRMGVTEAGAWTAAAAMSLLPIQAEAVGYLSAQAELWAACGVLCALLLATTEQWWLAIVPLAIAVLCKESAVMGVALVPLVRRQWQMWAVLTVAILVTVGVLTARAWHLPPTRAWAFWQLVAAGRLLTQVGWPNALTPDYDYAALARPVAMGYAGLALVGAALAAWSRSIGGVLAVSVVALRMVTVTPQSVLNSHQVYLAVAGLALCAGALTDRLACPR